MINIMVSSTRCHCRVVMAAVLVLTSVFASACLIASVSVPCACGLSLVGAYNRCLYINRFSQLHNHCIGA